MLLGFGFSNWMSFKGDTTFSMYASSERHHSERLAIVPKFKMRISPISLIFGGNASGKSNFVSALRFVKEFILKPPMNPIIPIKPYQLSKSTKNEASAFSVQLLLNDLLYEYSFSVDRTQVVSEILSQENSRSSYVLFERNLSKIEVDPDKRLSKKERERLKVIAQGTKKNRLFLSNTIDQQMNTWEFIYDWFRKLVIIDPKTILNPIVFAASQEAIDLCSHGLEDMGTGILKLEKTEVDVSSLGLSPSKVEEIYEKIDEGATTSFRDRQGNFYFLSMEDGEIKVLRLSAMHKTEEDESEYFDMSLESDGTIRLIDLIPAFCMAMDQRSQRVVVIDELDRSLHSKLSMHLLKNFLDTCGPDRRSQMIFTTHDMMLMDQEMFRRDEMWLVERDNRGVSTMMCMSDYKDIRSDKDVRKSYLEGRLGGIPVLKSVYGKYDLQPLSNTEKAQ